MKLQRRVDVLQSCNRKVGVLILDDANVLCYGLAALYICVMRILFWFLVLEVASMLTSRHPRQHGSNFQVRTTALLCVVVLLGRNK